MKKKRKQRSHKGFLYVIEGISRFLNTIAGIAITFIIAITVADVFLRTTVLLGRWLFRLGEAHGNQTYLAIGNFILAHLKPIAGTYELVLFSGGIVIGFALPLTSWLRAHIFVDFLILKFSQRVRDIFNVVTRCMVFVLFILIGWNMIKYAMDLQQAGEVSLTLQLPFFPVAYGIGVCCFIQCLVMVCDIVKIIGGKYE